MAHKLVGFADSSNSLITQYITDQLSAISNEIDGLATEMSDETDTSLANHGKKPDRLPCLMLFKNNTYKNCIHAKLDTDQAINWTKQAMG